MLKLLALEYQFKVWMWMHFGWWMFMIAPAMYGLLMLYAAVRYRQNEKC